MKKLFLGMLAIAAMVATSCVQEQNLGVNTGEIAAVSFNVGAPAMRANFSDGSTATHLQYAVYDANGTILNDLTVTNGDITGGSTTVTLQLVTGNTYSVLFWAAAPNAPYTVDLANKSMEVSYVGATCSDESRDAFYFYDTFTVNGEMSLNADLKRPFAQLNIGTNDYAAATSAGYTVSHAKVSTSAYTTLNFENGTVDGLTTVEFAYAAIPTAETFPVATYEYMAMNYLLMAKDPETVEVTFYYATDAQGANEKSRIVGSVPVQRNRRTNLYGALLTSLATVNVTILEGYDEPAHDVEAATIVAVNNAADLAAAVANAEVSEVSLGDDLVLSSSLSLHNRNLTINGNGKTISYADGNRANIIALFDVTYGSLTLNNITFDGVQGGGLVRTVHSELNMENVTVINGNYTGSEGFLRLYGPATIKNSTFKNNTCAMGLSFCYDGQSSNDNDPGYSYLLNVDNCVFEGNTCSSTGVLYYHFGAHGTVNNCTFKNNTTTTTGNGATVYMGWNKGTVTNCLFEGNSTTTTHATTKRVTGGLMVGNAGNYTNNAFINNTVTSAVEGLGNNAYAGTYYAAIDLSDNYWGGNAPVKGVDYYQEYENNNALTIDSYLTTYGE